MKKRLTAVILDVGGVLVEDVWENLYFNADGIQSIFPLISKEELITVGKDLWNKYAHNTFSEDKNWEKLEIDYWNDFIARIGIKHLNCTSTTDLISLSENFIKPVKGAKTFLEHINSFPIRISICSTNTEFWFSRQSKLLNLNKYIFPRDIILSCRTGFPKSSSDLEIFHVVQQQLKIDPQYCLFLDDNEQIVRLARTFGFYSVHFEGQWTFNKVTGLLE